MARRFGAIVTQLGNQRINQATVLDETVGLTYYALGDANGLEYLPTPSQTDIVNEVHAGLLSHKYADPNNDQQSIIEFAVPGDGVGGWTVRELAIRNAANETLMIASVPAVEKPFTTDGSGRELYFKVIIANVSAEILEIIVDPSIAIATRRYVDDEIWRHSIAQLDITELQYSTGVPRWDTWHVKLSGPLSGASGNLRMGYSDAPFGGNWMMDFVIDGTHVYCEYADGAIIHLTDEVTGAVLIEEFYPFTRHIGPDLSVYGATKWYLTETTNNSFFPGADTISSWANINVPILRELIGSIGQLEDGYPSIVAAINDSIIRLDSLREFFDSKTEPPDVNAGKLNDVWFNNEGVWIKKQHSASPQGFTFTRTGGNAEGDIFNGFWQDMGENPWGTAASGGSMGASHWWLHESGNYVMTWSQWSMGGAYRWINFVSSPRSDDGSALLYATEPSEPSFSVLPPSALNSNGNPLVGPSTFPAVVGSWTFHAGVPAHLEWELLISTSGAGSGGGDSYVLYTGNNILTDLTSGALKPGIKYLSHSAINPNHFTMSGLPSRFNPAAALIFWFTANYPTSPPTHSMWWQVLGVGDTEIKLTRAYEIIDPANPTEWETVKAAIRIAKFDTSQDWYNPERGLYMIELVGGGGSGGIATTSTTTGAGGGGSCLCAMAVLEEGYYTVIIGAGGAARNGTATASGNTGGASSIKHHADAVGLYANGGIQGGNIVESGNPGPLVPVGGFDGYAGFGSDEASMLRALVVTQHLGGAGTKQSSSSVISKGGGSYFAPGGVRPADMTGGSGVYAGVSGFRGSGGSGTWGGSGTRTSGKGGDGYVRITKLI